MSRAVIWADCPACRAPQVLRVDYRWDRGTALTPPSEEAWCEDAACPACQHTLTEEETLAVETAVLEAPPEPPGSAYDTTQDREMDR